MPIAVADDGTGLWWTMVGEGDSPAIVLSHSIGCDSTMWRPQVAALSGAFRVIVHDTRGHGRSEAPEGDYDLATLAADVASVMDAAGIERGNLCGLSLGGAVAQKFALDHPERLDRLVLANTAARIGSADGWTQRIAAVAEGGMAGIADMALARFFDPAFAARSPEVVEAIRTVFLSTPAHGYIGACAALRDADLTAEIAGISHSTLAIGGWDDVSTPPAQTQALADGVAQGRHLVLEAAHLSNLERPQEFSEAVLRFLTA